MVQLDPKKYERSTSDKNEQIISTKSGKHSRCGGTSTSWTSRCKYGLPSDILKNEQIIASKSTKRSRCSQTCTSWTSCCTGGGTHPGEDDVGFVNSTRQLDTLHICRKER